jgi:hypothetical protein
MGISPGQTHMDAKTYLSILRVHSEYVCQLATQLHATLTQLEQTLSEQPASHSTDTGGSCDGVAALKDCLAAEAEMFCKRLGLLLEQLKTGTEDAT